MTAWVPARLAPRPGPLGQLMRSFNRSLCAPNRSALTRERYLMSVGQSISSPPIGMLDQPGRIRRDHIETVLADFATTHAPSTVQTRYKRIELFFAFEEREISADPTASMKRSTVSEILVAVLGVDELEALLKETDGRDFVGRRDAAIRAC